MRKTMENTYHLFLDHLERETRCQTTKHQSMHHFWTPSREAIISARNELAIQASNALVRLSLDGGRVLAAIHLATNSFRASLKDPSKLTVNPKSDSTFAGSAFRGSAGSELCPFLGTPFLTHLSCQAMTINLFLGFDLLGGLCLNRFRWWDLWGVFRQCFLRSDNCIQRLFRKHQRALDPRPWPLLSIVTRGWNWCVQLSLRVGVLLPLLYTFLRLSISPISFWRKP